MRAFLAHLRDAFRRQTIAREFDDEMAFHLAELEREAIARGESPTEARATAARRFGNVTRTRETLRDRAGFPRWDELVNDVRFAARGLLRRPWLSGAIVLILTLGLGAAATINGLVDTIFLRPLPVAHPEQLYAVVGTAEARNDRLSRGTVRRLEESLPPGSVAAYHSGGRCTLQIGSQPATRASTKGVNGDFFATLGLVPAAGRLLGRSDDVPGMPNPVVVVSHDWARTNFGSPAAAIGREVVINRIPVAIVGVLPQNFHDISIGRRTDVWMPTALQPQLRISGNTSSNIGDDRPNDPDWNREERVSWLEVLVRSRPESPVSQAIVQRAWEPQRDDLARAVPERRNELDRRRWDLVKAPGGKSGFRTEFHSTTWLLAGVVAILLILVCTNVSGLLLVRSMSRHREIGVRLALGAGSFRVVRLALLEALLLSGIGALGGYALGSMLLPGAGRLLAPSLQLDLSLGLRPILAMSVLALFTALLSVLGPALWISRVQPLTALSGNGGLGRAPLRLGRSLVIVQFTLAVALVALAVTLGNQLQQSLAANPGFEREHVMTAIFDAESAGYRADEIQPLVERLRATTLGIPGVNRVGFAYNGILTGTQWSSGLTMRDPRARVHQRSFQQESALPGYFATIGAPLLLGRDFDLNDKADTQPVAIVSASFAREVFGDANPIGQIVGYGSSPSKEDFAVVGVVADIRANGVRADAPPLFYTSARQGEFTELHFLAVRFEGSPATVQNALRAAFARSEPGLVFAGWKTMEERMTDDVGRDRATTHLTSAFGACALVLAAFGVAGSLGYLVSLRQREFALRMAIGADAGKLLRSVLFDALRLAGLGCLAGVLLVWLLPLLPAVKPLLATAPGLTPAIVAAGLAMVAAALGGWFPARRAAHIDPMLTLKSD